MEKLYIAGKEQVFPHPLRMGTYNSKYHVVLLKASSKEIFNENVFMFDAQGNFLWQINKAIIDKYKTSKIEPFVYAEFEQDGSDYQLRLWNWGGWKVSLDPKTGEELSYEFTK